jgi:hypothetical protein
MEVGPANHSPQPTKGSIIHTFANESFRGFALSDHFISESGSFAVFLLGYNVIRGLSHYRIAVVPGSPPLLLVQRLASYAMADESAGARTRSRGFVSACSLGATGTRGLWIERTRGTLKRVVVAYTSNDLLFNSDVLIEDKALDEEEALPIDAHPIYEELAYDLHSKFSVLVYSMVSKHLVQVTSCTVPSPKLQASLRLEHARAPSACWTCD